MRYAWPRAPSLYLHAACKLRSEGFVDLKALKFSECEPNQESSALCRVVVRFAVAWGKLSSDRSNFPILRSHLERQGDTGEKLERHSGFATISHGRDRPLPAYSGSRCNTDSQRIGSRCCAAVTNREVGGRGYDLRVRTDRMRHCRMTSQSGAFD